MNVVETVKKTIKKYNLISSGDKVISAFSGGPDSTAMTFILNSLKDSMGFKLYAAHLNHGLRQSAREDEDFVRKFCGELGIDVVFDRIDIRSLSRGRNVEAVARAERYRFLERVRRKLGARVVCVGHTASDLVETVLFNLVKGSGISGLRGFLPRRGNIARPLFELSRDDVTGFLREKNIPFRVDETNFDLKFSRNFIRLKVVPELRFLNPSIEKTILGVCETLRELEGFIDSVVSDVKSNVKFFEDGFRIPLEVLRRLHPFIVKTLIQECFEEVSGEILSRRKLEAARNIVDKREFRIVNLKKGFSVYCDQHFFSVFRKKEPESFEIIVNDIPCVVKVPGGHFEIFYSDAKLEGWGVFCICEDDLTGNIFIRNRRRGDKVRLKFGMKKLSRIMIDKKVPAVMRDFVPVVADESGVLWVPGIVGTYTPGVCDKRFVCLRYVR